MNALEQGARDCLAGAPWRENPLAGEAAGAWDAGHTEMRAALRRAGYLVDSEAFAGFPAPIKESGS